ncbi:MAG: TonB family protein [Myxococcota bacterium]
MSVRTALAAGCAVWLLAAPLGSPAAPPEEAAVDAMPLGPSPSERLDEIRRRVQAAVVYPERARELGLEGITRIQFVIGADGLAQAVATVESSGHALLDRAAERGAVDAGQLPPLYGRIRIPVRFELDERGR